MTSNGCPKCEKLQYVNGGNLNEFMLCLGCQIEQADWEVSRWMKELERLKELKRKEVEND